MAFDSIHGGSAFSLNMTYDQTQTSKCISCQVRSADVFMKKGADERACNRLCKTSRTTGGFPLPCVFCVLLNFS